jgi:hypothetical protein
VKGENGKKVKVEVKGGKWDESERRNRTKVKEKRKKKLSFAKKSLIFFSPYRSPQR